MTQPLTVEQERMARRQDGNYEVPVLAEASGKDIPAAFIHWPSSILTAADRAASTTRVLGPPDAQLAWWEDRAEEGIRRALVQVMDQVADRIGKSLTAALVAHNEAAEGG